jgi:hypothetical protein
LCSLTEKGAAGIAAPIGEELQQEGNKKEKPCKPLAELHFCNTTPAFLDSTDQKWIYAE